jgi:hypothetical protein
MPAGSQGFGQSNPAGTLSEPPLVCDFGTIAGRSVQQSRSDRPRTVSDNAPMVA